MKPSLLFPLICAFVCTAPAATRTWVGASNNLWSNPNNWSPTGTPQPGEELEFKGGCPVPFCFRDMNNDLPNLRLNRLFFESADYTLSGNPLIITDVIMVGRTGAEATKLSVTINCALTLGGNVWFVANYGTGGIFDTDNLNHLHVNGPVNLNGFDLELRTGYADGNGELLGDHASRIYLDGVVSGAGDIIVVVDRSSRIEIGGSSGNTFNGTLRCSGLLGWNGPLVLKKQSGVAIPSARFEIWGGLVRLDRPNQIIDAATVVLNEGKLDLQDHDETFQNLELVGGDGWNHEPTLLDTGTGALTLLGTLTSRSTSEGVPIMRGRLALTGSHTFDISGTQFYGLDLQAAISGATDIIKSGTGSLILSGNSTYTGWLFVDVGSVEPRSANAFGSVNRGLALRGGSLRLINVTISGESLYAFVDNATLFSQGTSTWAGEIRLEQDMQIYGEDLTVAHVITGPGGLRLFGGTITLAGTGLNTFTGAMEVTCDLLRLNKPSNTRAFSGPLIVGGGFGTRYEVGWLNNFQTPPGANITIRTNGHLSLNDFTDIASNLTFHGGHVNLATDSALQVTGTIASNPTNTLALIDGATGLGSLFLSGQRTFNVGDGSGGGIDLRIDARVAGSGITKMGGGTLALGGNNAFAGPVIISNGIVRVDHDNALGTTSSGTTVYNGSTLFIGHAPDLVREPVTLNGTGFGGTNGALMAVGAVVLSNNVVLASPATIRVDSAWQFKIDGTISGTGPLTKIGGGTLTLAGSANNTFSGDTLVDAGTLQLDKADFVQAVPGNLFIGTGDSPTVPATVRHFSQDQIWANVTVNAGGLLDVNGYEEYVVTLRLNGGGDVQTGTGLLTVDAGNSITVNPGQRSATSRISGRLGLRIGNHSINVAPPFIPTPFDGPDLDVPAQIVFYNGIANIHKNGAGETRLGGANTFTGVLYVNSGRVIAANDSALGTTQGSTAVQTNGTLVLDGGITTSEFLILNSAAFPSLISLSGSNVVNAGVNLIRPDNGIEVQPAGGFLQVLGQVGSVGGLTKLGPGTLQFWGSVGNSYAGLTVISNGVIEANRADNILRVNRIAIPGDSIVGDDSTAVTLATLRALRAGQIRYNTDAEIHRSGLLDLRPNTGANLRIVTGAGRISLNTNASLTISNDVSFDFDGSISGTGALSKYGRGSSMHLTGDSPFSGPTTIVEGFYRIDGSAPNSPVTIKADAVLRGDGQVGALIVEANGIVRPTSKVPGHLGADLQMSSATFLAGGILGLGLYGPHLTGGNDSLIVNGPVSLDGTRLSSGFQYAPREGDTIMLIRKMTAGPVTGTFNGYPEGALRTLGETPIVMSYVGGDGNDVTLTVTNLAAGPAGTQVLSGNGNGLIEPDECNLIFLGVQNRRNTAITISNAVLRSLTPYAVVTIPEADYPIIPPASIRTNFTPFQLRTLPNLPCGAAVSVELQVTVVNEGTFAIPFTLPGGTNCTNGGGGCESCTIVRGTFTTNTPTLLRRLLATGGPSICLPEKPCPGPDEGTNLPPARYITHTFTNTTGSEACITAQLHFDCPTAPMGALHVAAYLGELDHSAPCQNYLGDSGAPSEYPPFSFRVPAGSNFVLVVSTRASEIGCDTYWLELFGLPCGPPTVQMVKDAAPGNVRLQWSTAYPGWRLQSVNAMNAAPPYPFGNVSGQPSIVEGKYTVTNAASGMQRFYRLAK
jgi:autotransporter-associated beta strand protein